MTGVRLNKISACRYWIIFFLIFVTVPLRSQKSGLYINEILASNASSDYDTVTSEYPDWIELHNSSSTPADISGYYLSTDRNNPLMWKIPNGAGIPANGFILFWADETDITNHTSFTLSKESGFIGLFTPAGTVADSFSYGFQLRDISYGRSVADPGGKVQDT